jgi:pSer/pThr/pTyr-binding forkhead associated (FHA) protein
MRVRLVPVEGGTPVEIHKDLSLVGRREDCDIFLDHKSISKLHCIVARTDGLLLLRDLGSTNGTRVNGQRVRRAALLPNDQLQIASLKYVVQFAPDEPAPPPEAAPEEYTQQLDPKDIQQVVPPSDRGPEADSDSDVEVPAVRANALPDHYPDSPSAVKK